MDPYERSKVADAVKALNAKKGDFIVN